MDNKLRSIIREIIESHYNVGFSNFIETMSKDIFNDLNSVIRKDDFTSFIEPVKIGSFKENYNDLFFEIWLNKSKKEFEDGSLYRRNVYLILNFDGFGNAKDLVKKEFKKIIGGNFNTKNDLYLLNSITYTPRKDEIDFRVDWIKQSLETLKKSIDKIYTKYTKLNDTGYEKV